MIDKQSHVPIYLQIEQILTEKIFQGTLKPGDPIPSETGLAEQYQVSRMTARKAVDYLVRQGVVERQRGRGTFICQPAQDLKMALPLDSHLTSSEVASSLNCSISNKLLHLEKVQAPIHVASDLNVKPGTVVWFMKRLRLIDDVPFVFESSFMLAEPLFADLTEDDLNHSKYQYLVGRGHNVKGSQKQIKAELPSEEIRVLLGLKRDEPVLFAHSVGLLEQGIPFEVSDIYYNQEHYTFTLNATR
ncbi:transcriptional regulator, GntR family protein [Vibrio ichthyoenteri ATCC 700023]|uniref:Transcriptional regulator, GntR family protein n=1 Tax=Vibrio ichthyoenteri ATCC 700023 TaxID=870968 RepID=F9RZF3_9VIBR|nr:GntR family transcriptional regulator [Vibrio ichthyoenteri]EGU45225.1 transcriptional regulator, GntR family protein [Vibrio ichthyoenteri ATCC 700023]